MTVLKNGWLRLTLVAWAVWVLWTMSQHSWGLDNACLTAYGVSALCCVWEFGLPPVLALGAWWVVRGFGKEAVAAWAAGNKALLVILAALVGVAGYLGAQVRLAEREVEGSIEAVASKVDDVEGTVGEVKDEMGEVKHEVRDVSDRVDELVAR